jgi:hypothetical protein
MRVSLAVLLLGSALGEPAWEVTHGTSFGDDDFHSNHHSSHGHGSSEPSCTGKSECNGWTDITDPADTSAEYVNPGMRDAMLGKDRCLYGHTSEENVAAGGYSSCQNVECYGVTYHTCACISQEHALKAHGTIQKVLYGVSSFFAFALLGIIVCACCMCSSERKRAAAQHTPAPTVAETVQPFNVQAPTNAFPGSMLTVQNPRTGGMMNVQIPPNVAPGAVSKQ